MKSEIISLFIFCFLAVMKKNFNFLLRNLLIDDGNHKSGLMQGCLEGNKS